MIHRQPPANIFDVRVEAAILMHNQHSRKLPFNMRRLRQIGTQCAVAVW